MYRNLGQGRFKDITEQAGLGGKGLVGGPATTFDFNNDGLLDIYITYFGDYPHGKLPTLERRNTNGLPNQLFKNVGQIHFQNVTTGSGVDNTGWGQAVTHSDMDGDGWQDLIVGNDFGVNAYYQNQKDGTFKDISKQIGTHKPSYTMSISMADLNRDQLPDFYISNIVTMNKDEKYVLPTKDTVIKFDAKKLAQMRVLEANDLFLSESQSDKGIRYVMSKAVGRGYSSTGWAWDADFFDMDNDSDDDLYVLNGMNEFNVYGSENPYYTDPRENKKRNVYIPVSIKESNVLFVNEKGVLRNVSEHSGTDLLGNSPSAAYFDYDLDGDLDIALNNYHEAAVIYRNNAEQFNRNWLKIELMGDPSQGVNRDAIGARLILMMDNDHQIWREVHGSIGYQSVHPKQQHFGLGKIEKATLMVKWPNGQTAVFKDLTANQYYLIKQEDGSVRVTHIYLNPSAIASEGVLGLKS
ncbi:MAG: hypothetical protein GKR87_12785 [Kiritimatiellae bacterium]|nr:hypothetical protein [Kiritimatiellia bacterium]